MPFSIIRKICESERPCTFDRSAMLGARSLPFPSRPWHPAQLDEKIFLPRIEAGLMYLWRESGCAACAFAARLLTANKATTGRKQNNLEVASIGYTRILGAT